MAFTTATLSGGNANLDITIEQSNADTENNITATASSTLYLIKIDATENPGEDVEVRFFDNAAPVVGTTDAHAWFWGKAGAKSEYRIRRGIPFTAAMSVATVTSLGATSGGGNPTGKVNLRMHAKDS